MLVYVMVILFVICREEIIEIIKEEWEKKNTRKKHNAQTRKTRSLRNAQNTI